MCDLCTQHKKVFTHEHDLFAPKQLRQHQEHGDDKPGAIDQSGFKGHPKCGFCKESFYGDDELFVHCREKHEKCHICDRRTPGRPHYYLNYNTLEGHFRKDHFLCLDKECLEKKFVVFDSEMDFKAHNLESHPNGLTKDARRVDLSNFVVRLPYHPPSRGRDGRGRGRGREPPAEREPLPQSSAQPLRRDELAFQRQLAIQTAQQPTQAALHSRFNGQITTESSSGSGDASHTHATQAPPSVPSLLEVGRGLPPQAGAAPNTAPHLPRDQLRHQRVQTRAAQLLKDDPSKIEEFQQLVSRFNRGGILAIGLVESLVGLSGIGHNDVASPEVGSLVKELAELFDETHKHDALMAAWNDRRARTEVEDYPTLPPGAPAPTAGGAAGWHAGARVLRLKSATAQSSRSPVARPAAWGSAATVGANGGRGGASSSNSSPWSGAPTPIAGATPTAPRTPSAASVAARPATTGGGAAGKKTAAAAVGGGARAGASRAALADAAAFPALPAAQAPAAAGFTSFTPGAAGGRVVRRDLGRATGNAWDAASGGGRGPGAGSPNASTAAEDVGGEAGAAGKAKKSGRKKQTLMHFG